MSLKDLIEGRGKKIGAAGRRAERDTLKRTGALATPASGAGPAKGDGVLPEFLVENKSTTADSFRLKLETLLKITHEAEGRERQPVVMLQYTDGNGRSTTEREWVVITEKLFKELTDV